MKYIIEAKTLQKIPYMENPPAEGGEMKYLTPEEFQKKFHCEYTEGVVTEQLKQEPVTENDFKDARAKAAYERLLHPLENLVICKMSHDIGYGLFTTEDISVGTVLCIYAGAYDTETRNFIYSCGGVDATKMGGMSRFMQHQPISKKSHEAYLMQGLKNPTLFAIQENISEEQAKIVLNDADFFDKKIKEYEMTVEENDSISGYDFEQYQFSNDELINQVAQSNIATEKTTIAGMDITVMIASRDIKQYESIGFSYGIMYWKHPSIPEPPLLFSKMGEILSKNLYTYDDPESVKEASAMLNFNPLFNFSPNEGTNLLEQFYSLFSGRSSEEVWPKKIETAETSNSEIHFEEVEKKLQDKTSSFFKKLVHPQWKKYPESKLVDKYVGHQVRFFTMDVKETKKAKAFFGQLKDAGFDVELKKTKNDKPSLVVDLTTSK